jgi:short-subunit dehydrogenase
MTVFLKMAILLAALLEVFSFTRTAMLSQNSRSRSMSMMARKKKEMPPNPVVLVTGGSRGIGKAIALALGEAGCKVVVNYASNEAAALEVCNEINQLGGSKGGSATPIKCNIGSVDEIKVMFEKINTEVGPLDVLVNNAGITRDMLTMMMKPTDFTDVIDTNLSGVFFCAQAAFTGSMMGQVCILKNHLNDIILIKTPCYVCRNVDELLMSHQSWVKLVIQAKPTTPRRKVV